MKRFKTPIQIGLFLCLIAGGVYIGNVQREMNGINQNWIECRAFEYGRAASLGKQPDYSGCEYPIATPWRSAP